MIARIASGVERDLQFAADATSMPSTRPAIWQTSAGIGLAFIA
jgi:hypothetical protein